MEIAITVLILLLVGLVAACLYFFKYLVVRKNREFFRREDIDPAIIEAFRENAELKPVDLSVYRQESWEMRSHDGLLLKATYFKPEIDSRKTVILVHGYKSNAFGEHAYAPFYLDQLGYNVLIPDLRSHGQSEGRYIGFGWLDRLDILGWIEKLTAATGPDTQIMLHGTSMGGATVLMTSGENLPPQVKAVVSDCAYTSVDRELASQIGKTFRLPVIPFVPLTSLICRIVAGYSFYEASALRQVARSTQPTLFIHGDKDDFVPTSMIYDLHRACRSPKDLMIVPGAVHGASYFVDTEGYQAKVAEFAARFMTESGEASVYAD